MALIVGIFLKVRAKGREIPIIEIFTWFLDNVVAVGRFPYHPKCLDLKITHLCLVDDLFIFRYSSLQASTKVKKVLNQFYLILNLEVNLAKCDIFLFKVNDVIAMQL